MPSLLPFFFKSLSTEKSKAKVEENIFSGVSEWVCKLLLTLPQITFPPSFKCDGENLKITDGQRHQLTLFFPHS